jgi:hypothetical protein
MPHRILTVSADEAEIALRKIVGISLRKAYRTHDFRDTLRARWKNIPSNPERNTIMGHVIKPVQNTSQTVTIVDVPDEISAELEELWTYLTENPGQYAHVEFDTAGERGVFENQARSWGVTRDPAVNVRQRRNKEALPDTEWAFTLRLQSDVDAATEAAKAAKAAKEAAAKNGAKPGAKATPKFAAPTK